MRVLFAHLQEDPPDLSQTVGGAITPAVAKAINKALEKLPEDRPAAAAGYISSIARAAGF